MSRRVFSRGRVIGGTASLASVCEFVEFTFIGIFKTDDTPKTCRFSTALQSPAWLPAAIALQFFQIKRLVFGIASESAMDRVTRITDSDFADEKIDPEIDQCRRCQCGHG